METTIQELKGNWKKGWALDLNTVRTALLEDGSMLIKRTEIGELLYGLKYLEDKSCLKGISEALSRFIREELKDHNIDAIIPVPPSNLSRESQPVFLIAQAVADDTSIHVDYEYLKKIKATSELIKVADPLERKKILKGAFSVKDSRYKDKNVILFDDIFSSGQTLMAVSEAIAVEGHVKDIYVLTVTRTRITK
jgi:predicted amidophosphoribosyltransferase